MLISSLNRVLYVYSWFTSSSSKCQIGISATRGLTRCVLGILFVSNMASLYQYPVPVPPLSASKLISSVEITRANWCRNGCNGSVTSRKGCVDEIPESTSVCWTTCGNAWRKGRLCPLSPAEHMRRTDIGVSTTLRLPMLSVLPGKRECQV